MLVYTYSEARQKLAVVLEQAENTGKVIIRRKDGRTFALTPEKIATSPLNVPSIKADITSEEIVDIIREGRERQNWESILHCIDQLEDFPDSERLDIKELKNHPYGYRMRVGRYRIIFDYAKVIKIIKIQEVKKREERTY